MTMPKAYSPEYGYTHQILIMCPDEREYEHCDYAKSYADKNHLVREYRLAYGTGFRFKAILLPQKYWKEKVPESV